jgi:hypothetical protein
MSNEIMKVRTEKELTKMGYSISEINILIDKYWNEVSYLSTARQKALYMVA